MGVPRGKAVRSRWAAGALSEHHTTVLLTVEETLEALRKASSIAYRAPGDR